MNLLARPRVPLLLAGAAVAIGLAISREPIAIVALVFVLVVPFEKLFPRHRGQPVRRPGVGTDLAYALAAPILQVVTLVVAVAVGLLTFAWLPGLAISPLVSLVPPVILPFVGIAPVRPRHLLGASLVARGAAAVALPRHPPLAGAARLDQRLPRASLRRRDPGAAVRVPPRRRLRRRVHRRARRGADRHGLFLHANVRWRWRPLHRVVITPEFHHWHHANEVDAIHSNYSVFLPLWDIVFGTYYMPATVRPLRYGVDEFIPDGMAAQLTHPFRRETVRPGGRCRRGAAIVREVATGIARSTTRSRNHRPRRGEPLTWATSPPSSPEVRTPQRQ